MREKNHGEVQKRTQSKGANLRRLPRAISVEVRAQGASLALRKGGEMSAIDTVLVALGAGDRQLGARMAAIAVLTALPTWVVLAVFLAIGPAR